MRDFLSELIAITARPAVIGLLVALLGAIGVALGAIRPIGDRRVPFPHARHRSRPSRLPIAILLLLLIATPQHPLLPLLVAAIGCLLLALWGGAVLAVLVPLLPRRWRSGATQGAARLRVGLAALSVGVVGLGCYVLVAGTGGAPAVGAAVSSRGPGSVVSLAGGSAFTLAARADGTVWKFGRGDSGTDPVRVRGLSGIAAVAAGSGQQLALRRDGTVWAWGYNDYGAVGDGTTTFRSAPVPLAGLTDVVAVAAGEEHSLALKADGTVWAWGLNDGGQLGFTTTTTCTRSDGMFTYPCQKTPRQVVGLGGVTALDGGGRHSLALLADGTVRAWGSNVTGQLGNGSTANSTVPVQVGGLGGVTAIAAGTGGYDSIYGHSLALKSDGTIWAWGENEYGQLGTASGGSCYNGRLYLRCSTTPLLVSTVGGATAIAAGHGHSLATKSDGTVWAWGLNVSGQLGNPRSAVCTALVSPYGPIYCSSTPLRVNGAQGFTNLVSVAAGEEHSLAIEADGTVWAWGANGSSRLGTASSDVCTHGSQSPCSLTALSVKLAFLSPVTAMGAGGGHSLALKDDDPAWAWGVNVSGQLGDRTVANTPAPVQIGSLSGVSGVSGGGNHSLAIKEGEVWAWGDNGSGQLGDGTTTNRPAPARIAGLTGVIAVAGGGAHSLALKADGTVWAWGANQYGQLGDGSTTQRSTPVQVGGLAGVTAIAAGQGHSVALKGDGSVWSWGLNANGQLGNRSTKNSSSPVAARNLTNAYAIAAGASHSLAAATGATVWSWGLNASGQLGDGTTSQRTSPVQVPGLNGANALAAGQAHSLALLDDGTVRAWGLNDAGQLGDGSTTQRLSPVVIGGLAGATTIAAGSGHGLALKVDGTLWAWGKNDVGQLGDCTSLNRTAPVKVCGLDGMAGSYEALHNSPQSVAWTGHAADPVNVILGNFQLPQLDLALPGRGVPIGAARHYDSLNRFNVGFGAGWSFAYIMQIGERSATETVVYHGDGRQDKYTLSGGVLTPPPGVFDRLVKNANGSYSLTTPQQLVYEFGTDRQLSSVRDRNGDLATGVNVTTIVRLTGATRGLRITDPAERGVTLEYGPLGSADQYRFVKLAEVGGLNRTVGYKYDPPSGELREVTDVRGNVTKYYYDPLGRLNQVVDPLTHTVAYNEYDVEGRVTRQRDGVDAARGCNPCASDITFVHDRANHQTLVKDRRGKTTTYRYDVSYRLTEVQDPLGRTEKYGYDTLNNRTSVTDRWGFARQYEYDTGNARPDARGNLLSVTDPLLHTTRYAYTAQNDVAIVTVPVDAGMNRATTFEYGDPHHNLTAIVDPAGRTVLTPDPANGDLLQVQDPSGVATTFRYDQYGNRDRVARTAGGVDHTWQFLYDAGSRLKKLTDPLLHTIDYDYNAANQPTLVATHPAPGVTLGTTADYDAAGNPLWVQDANGHRTTFTLYDENNNLKTAVDAFTGHAASRAYDANNNRTTATDGSGKTTTYQYDDANWPQSVTDNGGNAVAYTYAADPAGHLVTIRDANLKSTAYRYDAGGRLVEVRDPSQVANPALKGTRYEYFWDDQLRLVTDANDHATTYRYDAAGRPDRRTDHGGRSWTTVYDPNGRIRTRSDPNGVVATHGYDGYGRLTSIGYGGGTPPTATPAVAYAYDDADRRCWVATGAAPGACGSPPAGATTYAYDDTDRLMGVTAPGTGAVGYQYDGTGRVTRLSYPSGRAATFDYGTADHLKVGDGQAPVTVTDYGYDGAGRLAAIAYPNGVATTYDYDAAGRLSGVAHKQGGATLASVSYPVIDGNGNRKAAVEVGTANAGTTTYAYDDLNRLTGATYPDGSRAGWGYDPVGNRTTATATPPGGTAATTTYAHDPTNRLCWAAPGTPAADCAAAPANATTYAHDAAGNRVGKVEAGVTTAYGYDGENRLTSVTISGTQAASYTYDGDGYRVGKVAGGAATAYTWDRAGLGTVIGDGQGENIFGPAGLQQRVAGGAAQYAHGDGLGSVRLVTDGAGQAVGGASYDPWGTPKAGAAATLGGFGFAGEQADGETGFSYLRARHYDPATGRFLQEDPAGMAGSGTNLYPYAANNPTGYVDPSGMFWDTLFDVGSIAFDVYQLATGGWDRAGENAAFLALDVAGAAIPFVPAPGTVARAGRLAAAAGHAADAARGGDETISLFRAVGPNELADIKDTGRFRVTPGFANYQGGKLFATTLDDARRFGDINVALGGRPYTIVEATIPKAVHDRLGLYVQTMDLMPAVFVAVEKLRYFSRQATIRVIP